MSRWVPTMLLLLAVTAWSSASANGDTRPSHVKIYFLDWAGMERVALRPEEVREHPKVVVELRGEPFVSTFVKSLPLGELTDADEPDPSSARLVIDITYDGDRSRTLYATRFNLVDEASGKRVGIDEAFRERFMQVLQ